MKFLVDLELVYAEAYKLMAKDMGWGSRQEMVEYILKSTMDQYPNYLYEARPGVAVKMAVAQHEEEFVPMVSKPSEEEMAYWAKEIGVDLVDLPREQSEETPDLPEL